MWKAWTGMLVWFLVSMWVVAYLGSLLPWEPGPMMNSWFGVPYCITCIFATIVPAFLIALYIEVD